MSAGESDVFSIHSLFQSVQDERPGTAAYERNLKKLKDYVSLELEKRQAAVVRLPEIRNFTAQDAEIHRKYAELCGRLEPHLDDPDLRRYLNNRRAAASFTRDTLRSCVDFVGQHPFFGAAFMSDIIALAFPPGAAALGLKKCAEVFLRINTCKVAMAHYTHHHHWSSMSIGEKARTVIKSGLCALAAVKVHNTIHHTVEHAGIPGLSREPAATVASYALAEEVEHPMIDGIGHAVDAVFDGIGMGQDLSEMAENARSIASTLQSGVAALRSGCEWLRDSSGAAQRTSLHRDAVRDKPEPAHLDSPARLMARRQMFASLRESATPSRFTPDFIDVPPAPRPTWRDAVTNLGGSGEDIHGHFSLEDGQMSGSLYVARPLGEAPAVAGAALATAGTIWAYNKFVDKREKDSEGFIPYRFGRGLDVGSALQALDDIVGVHTGRYEYSMSPPKFESKHRQLACKNPSGLARNLSRVYAEQAVARMNDMKTAFQEDDHAKMRSAVDDIDGAYHTMGWVESHSGKYARGSRYADGQMAALFDIRDKSIRPASFLPSLADGDDTHYSKARLWGHLHRIHMQQSACPSSLVDDYAYMQKHKKQTCQAATNLVDSLGGRLEPKGDSLGERISYGFNKFCHGRPITEAHGKAETAYGLLVGTVDFKQTELTKEQRIAAESVSHLYGQLGEVFEDKATSRDGHQSELWEASTGYKKLAEDIPKALDGMLQENGVLAEEREKTDEKLKLKALKEAKKQKILAILESSSDPEETPSITDEQTQAAKLSEVEQVNVEQAARDLEARQRTYRSVHVAAMAAASAEATNSQIFDFLDSQPVRRRRRPTPVLVPNLMPSDFTGGFSFIERHSQCVPRTPVNAFSSNPDSYVSEANSEPRLILNEPEPEFEGSHRIGKPTFFRHRHRLVHSDSSDAESESDNDDLPFNPR